MHKFILLLFALTFSTALSASEVKVISYDEKNDPQQYYLYGTSKGNYIVKSWQFDASKIWNGKGDPQLTISSAVAIARMYLKANDELAIKEIELRPSFNKKGDVLWYYFITFSKTPLKFGQEEYEVAVLTSGEVVAPYKR